MIHQTLAVLLILSSPTFEFAVEEQIRATGAKVTKWNENSDVNPEELGNFHEGDILIPANKNSRETLLCLGGRVYYEISPDFDGDNMNQIRNAMAHISNRTCIKFLPRSSDQPDYVKFTANNSGCWTSTVGRLGGKQMVNLQIPSCLRKQGNVVHQLVHVLGLGHEHNRPDRNQYVDILWKNVNDGYAENFNNIDTDANLLSLPYDPYSITHYSSKAFASNKELNTIEPKSPHIFIDKIGQRDGLTFLDIQKINTLYEKYCTAYI